MITIWYLRWIFIIRKNRGVIQLVGIPFFSLSILLLLRLHFYTIIIILTDFNQNFELSLQQKLGKPCKNGIKYLPRARWLWVLVGHPPPRSRFCPHQAEMQQNNLFRQNNQPYLFLSHTNQNKTHFELRFDQSFIVVKWRGCICHVDKRGGHVLKQWNYYYYLEKSFNLTLKFMNYFYTPQTMSDAGLGLPVRLEAGSETKEFG